MEIDDTNEHNNFKSKPSVKYAHDDYKSSSSDCKIEDDSLSNDNEINRNYNSNNPDSDSMDQENVKKKEDRVELVSDVIADDQLQTQIGSSTETNRFIPLPNSYSNYNYNTSDNFYVHTNQQMYSVYNACDAMNTQWSSSEIKPFYMQSNDEMIASASTTVAQSAGFEMSSNIGGICGFIPYAPGIIGAYNTMVTGGYSSNSMYSYHTKFIENEILYLPKCSLTPPGPYVKIGRKNPKPPNCKTIFVGYLPQNKTDDIIREIFSLFGEVEIIRMSKKNFCHVRFTSVETPEKALILSGYTLKIGYKDDSANSSRIHVDYARAKNDQYEWDCLLSAKVREFRQQFETKRSPSPSLVYYSENEACSLIDKLKNEDTFVDALHILGSWINRGECTRRTCGVFFSMIQSSYIQGKRLFYEKNKLDEKSDRARSEILEKDIAVSVLLIEIREIFHLIQLPNIWNMFDKTQKKQLDKMRQRVVDIIGYSKERDEYEMYLSDHSCVLENPPSCFDDQCKITKEMVEEIKQKRNNLQKQLEAALQEHAFILKNSTKNFIAYNKQIHEKKEKLYELCRKKDEYFAGHSQDIVEISEENQSSFSNITEEDMCFLILITTFLHFHPKGASNQYISAYLQRIDPTITDGYVENLMKNHSNMFQEKISNIDADSRIWICTAINSNDN